MLQRLGRIARRLARRQHWVIARVQLLAIGYTEDAIDYRIEIGRLHPIHAGVYAVDRPAETFEALWMAAVLACGEHAGLSDETGAQLWQMRARRPGRIHVSVPTGRRIERPGIEIHRRSTLELTSCKGIPVTTPIRTIVDISRRLTEFELERAINEAVNRDLLDLDELHEAARGRSRPVRRLLQRDEFVVTTTVLEQRLLRIIRRAGLPAPASQRRLPGGRVDFLWPERKLIVEADSLRFHRTPSQQRKDRLRDQRNLAAGIRTLRFTHWQVCREPEHVAGILRAVAA